MSVEAHLVALCRGTPHEFWTALGQVGHHVDGGTDIEFGKEVEDPVGHHDRPLRQVGRGAQVLHVEGDADGMDHRRSVGAARRSARGVGRPFPASVDE